MPLTDKQQLMMDFIETYTIDRGFPPTIRDIQEGCKISSTSVVDYNLRILERGGLLKRSREISRGIELTRRKRSDSIQVPVLGPISAGNPLMVAPIDIRTLDSDDHVAVPEEIINQHREIVAFNVKGQSMINAHIDDGDVVILSLTREIGDGDIVAAWLKTDDEITLKRYFKEDDQIRLQPENDEMEPIIVNAADVEIHGKVVYLMRGY